MRTSSKLLLPILALLVVGAFSGRAAADDDLLSGYGLTLKDHPSDSGKRYVSIFSKDSTVTVPGTLTTLGATLRVIGSTFDATYDMPSSGWSLGTGGKVRYRDTHTVNGPIRIADLHATKFKLSGKGAQLLHSLATDPGTIQIVFTSGTTRLCLEYGGVHKFRAGKILTARGAPAPAACAD